MKKLLLAIGVFALINTQEVNAQSFTQDFESTADSSLPTGWSQVSTAAGAWKTGINTFLQSSGFSINAHTKMVAVNDDKQGQTGATADNSNDLLETNVVNLALVPTPYVKFDQYFFANTYSGATESLNLVISTDGGTTWTTVATIAGNTVSPWETRYYSLAAYSTQTNVKIGFRYSDGGGWLYGAALDNISVFTPSANDISFASITPALGTPGSYGIVSSNITLGGTVFNNGSNTITSFTTKYQQGTGAVVSDVITGVNIAPFTSYTFTHNVPFNIPSLSTFPIKMWTELTGDINHTNDTLNTSIVGASFKPTKKLLVEEGTGTWCGWCPRGAVYTDSVWHTYQNSFSVVAVHNGDPMTLTAYDSWMGGQISGYPSVVIDRREVLDPSDLINVYNTESNNFGFADLTLGTETISGTTITVPVTVKPAVNLNGDYRLVLVVTEDGVTGTGSGYDQNNYYSSTQANQPLVGAGHNWQTSPDPVPAAQMQYNFVARAISPSPTGSSATVNWTANQTYNQTLTATLDPSWNTSKLRAVVMLIDGSTGTVLNSNNKMSPTSVTNINAGLEAINIYPNPTSNAANVKFNLTESSNVQIQLIDAVGKVVYSTEQQMNSGAQLVTIPTANMANGLYNVKIQTEKGAQTVRLTVIK